MKLPLSPLFIPILILCTIPPHYCRIPMPDDHTIAAANTSEARFSEDDLDAALAVIRDRADGLGPDHELHAALMIETAEHMHRYLLEEC